MAASPAPMAILAAKSSANPKLAAAGVRKVKMDHQRTAAPSTNLPPNRLASQPLGTINSMYPIKKDDNTSPLVVSLQPYSACIAIIATEIFTRSM